MFNEIILVVVIIIVFKIVVSLGSEIDISSSVGPNPGVKVAKISWHPGGLPAGVIKVRVMSF